MLVVVACLPIPAEKEDISLFDDDDVPNRDTGEQPHTGETGEPDPPRDRSDFINTEQVVAIDDDSCWSLGAEYIDDAPLAERVTTQSLRGTVVDSLTEGPVEDALVDLWFGDDPTGSADLSPNVDASTGEFDAEVPVCQPLTWRIQDPWGETVPTYRPHQVWEWSESGPVEDTLPAFGETAASLIPAIIGIDWDRDDAIVSGTVLDCAGDGIEHAQVWFHAPGEDAPPDQGDVFYFDSNGLPSPHDVEADTEPNGLWVAINVPEGDWEFEAMGWDGEDYVSLAWTSFTVAGGSATLAQLDLGHGEVPRYPDGCLGE